MIEVSQLAKCYKIYEQPADRLKQALFRGKRKYFKEFWPVKGVSFRIAKGEIVGLIGANGSGKSTLLQLICGILKPTSGGVVVDGRIAALLELGSGFNPEFSGHDNIFMNAALLGLSRDEINLRYADIVEFAGIGDFLYQPVNTYSSGMVVRLAFAISSFVDADVLVVDEALSVGDVGFQAKCLERMERLMQAGTTVLLVTHDVQMVKRYCDRVIYLKQGELVYDGDPEEATERYLAETRESAFANQQFTRPDTASSQAKMRVVNSLGAITSAILTARDVSATSVVIGQGERLTLTVTAKVAADLKHPRVQMTVRDMRGYNLFGFNNIYGNQEIRPDINGEFKVSYSFAANLQAGDYAITLRLDDSNDVNQVNLIDKQVGIVDFTVTAPQKRFDAVIDLNGRCEDVI